MVWIQSLWEYSLVHGLNSIIICWSHHTPSLLYFTPSHWTARLHDSSYICIWQVGGKKGAYKFLPAWLSPAVLEAGLTLAGQIKRCPRKYFCSCEREGAGLLLRSMMSLINGHNLLLWQKNRSEGATSFETVIWGVIKERIFTHSRQAMAEFPGASFGQPDPPSLSRNKGKKRSHEDDARV